MPKVKVIKPKEGLKVPYPLSNKFLPPEGAPVEMTSYWVRRMKEGAIEEAKAPTAKSRATTTKNKNTSNQEIEK